MVIDGKYVAHEIRASLRSRVSQDAGGLRLGVIVANDTREIRTFVELKRRFGSDIGVEVHVIPMDAGKHTTEDLLQTVLHASREYDGLILQLPIPTKFDLDAVLHLFPLSHDVDVMGHMAYQQYKEGRLPFDPPVVAAMAEVLHRQKVRLAGLRVLVIGEGRLVGGPAAIWAEHMGATVKVVNKETSDFDAWVRGSDVIICGAGAPGILTPNNITEGVIILDAGTSESGGVLRGDADPACAEMAQVFTPTPGGIGPITVAKLFENFLALHDLQKKQSQAVPESVFENMSKQDSYILAKQCQVKS